MRRAALIWFTTAAGIGTVHAAASLYWALGGDALADTVGAWAVEWRAGSPVAAGFALAAIGLIKLIAASVPWKSARSGGPRGALRLLCWAGSALLVAYGLANTAVANLALIGVVGSVDDLAATRGHAWLWDPLFLAWGLSLGAGLWQTRRRLARQETTAAALPLDRSDDAKRSSLQQLLAASRVRWTTGDRSSWMHLASRADVPSAAGSDVPSAAGASDRAPSGQHRARGAAAV